MKNDSNLAVLVAGLFVLASYGVHRWDTHAQAQRAAQALDQISNWSSLPRLVARETIEKYGPPQAILAGKLAWDAHRPWKRIAVLDVPTAPLEQVVAYSGPTRSLQDLVLFSYGSRVYADGADLAARGNTEELNLLSLNLGDDIAQGRRTPAEAKRLYLRTLRLAVSGKASPYMEKLRFPVLR